MSGNSNGKTYLPNSTWCFVCGEENPAGLQGRFYVEDGVVKFPLRAQTHHCGYKDVVHGGVIAAALDECMGWAAARAVERMCVTAELTVRYLRRTPANMALTACSEVAKLTRRVVDVKGRLMDDDGIVYAEAQGRFVPVSVEETLAVDDMLTYRERDARLFAKLRESGEKEAP